MYTFLAINGIRLTRDPHQTYAFIASLYDANQFSLEKIVPWLRNHTEARAASGLAG